MVGCLIVYHRSITSLTKSKILRAMFHEREFEIHIEDHHTAILYVWGMEKEEIWQAATNFISSKVLVGYGFGDEKNEAEEAARKILNLQ
jgi:hypothetical protein